MASAKALTALLALAIVSSCNRPKPKLPDEAIQRLRNALPGLTEECLTKMRYGGIEAAPSERVDQCYEMMRSQRWRGLWRDDFEGSRFCPAPAQQCAHGSPGDKVWLTFGEGVLRDDDHLGELYAIDFIGRRTLQKAHNGQMGMSDHEIIVDRLISITPIASHP